MGEVLKSFFNFAGISLKTFMAFLALVVGVGTPIATWIWKVEPRLTVLEKTDVSQETKIAKLETLRGEDIKEHAAEAKELANKMEAIQRSLGRIEGALGTK